MRGYILCKDDVIEYILLYPLIDIRDHGLTLVYYDYDTSYWCFEKDEYIINSSKILDYWTDAEECSSELL